jgi:autotransporter-associated beta strand protein
MKGHPHLARRFLAILLFGRRQLAPLLLTFLFLAPQLVLATDREWTGTTNTTWSTSTNWSGGVPGNTDNAKFDLSFSNQPNLTANATVGGLWMATGVGQNVTISGSMLTLQGNTINGTAGLGILMDNTSAFTLTVNASLTLGAAQIWRNNSGNLLTIAGGLDLNGNNLTIDGSGNATISGVVSDSQSPGGGNLTKNGSGTLILSGSNTFNGSTTLNAGSLDLNSTRALGTGAFTINGGTIDNTSGGAITLSTNNAITVSGNFTFGGTNDLNFGGGKVSNGGNYTITLNGTNSTLTFGGVMKNTLNAAQTTTVNGAGNTLVLGGYTLNNANQVDTINGSGNVTITGAIANGGKATTSGLTYSGTGTLTLSGTNTYGGATTVNSGTVLINGSNSGATGAVSVNNSGTTLGGTGTIGGAVTVGNGARILGGTGSAASGTLKLANNLTLNSGSIIELALGASGAHSTLARTGGTWTFGSTQAFTFIDLGAQPGNYTNIITGLASNPGTEANWTITNTGWIGSFSYSGGNISLNVVAVPEPATYLAGFLALVALGYHQRRRLSSLLQRA